MSYAVEWMGGVVVYWIALLLLLVPWFAAVAVVVATTAVLVAALAALASPYLLVRRVRRHLAQPRTPWFGSPSGIRSRSTAGSPAELGRAHLTVLAHDEPDEAGAILEDAARHAA
jgi:hypothetical protein